MIRKEYPQFMFAAQLWSKKFFFDVCSHNNPFTRAALLSIKRTNFETYIKEVIWFISRALYRIADIDNFFFFFVLTNKKKLEKEVLQPTSFARRMRTRSFLPLSKQPIEKQKRWRNQIAVSTYRRYRRRGYYSRVRRNERNKTNGNLTMYIGFYITQLYVSIVKLSFFYPSTKTNSMITPIKRYHIEGTKKNHLGILQLQQECSLFNWKLACQCQWNSMQKTATVDLYMQKASVI